MSHCPQCGELPPEGARACPFCGSLLSVAGRAPLPASRTIVGVSIHEVAAAAARAEAPSPATTGAPAPPPPAPPAGAFRANHTIVGMPATVLPQGPGAAETPAGPLGNRAPLAGGRTIVGMVASANPAAAHRGPQRPVQAPPAGARPLGGTLLGVARPGIAPLTPGELDDAPALAGEPDPSGYAPAHELGATIGAGAVPEAIAVQIREHERDRRRRRVIPGVGAARRADVRPVQRDDERASRRALAMVLSAGGLALAAVLVALFWPSAPPLTARARADASGREGVELVCKSCPDGTKLTIAGASAVAVGGMALVPLPTALSVGENRFKVAIDRPGNGRDETVNVSVNVAYRIRPDLATLQAEKPAFQILAEVAGGTTVTIDGHAMTISGGHGVENVDVSEACTGLAGEVKTLSRQVPYTVTPPEGTPERGVVNVSVGIVPLHLDAPVAIASSAPHVVTDGPSFVLAGWTMKGAEVLAAGRPITVHPDGTFAQVMNVSSVGATQIEVRARMPGMAPRLTQIKVRRVESLEKAARDLASAEPPIPFAQLVADIPAAAGKAVAFTGEVSESKKQGYETVMLLEVSQASGCRAGGSCTVRLVQGSDNPAKRGDMLRVFGHVARAFSVPGRTDIPEIEVDFTLKGDSGGARERR
jgi:hypothetical protein